MTADHPENGMGLERATVTIMCDNGTRQQVDGYVIPWIHHIAISQAPDGSCWNITHERSGSSVVAGLKTLEAAVVALVWLAELTDWSKEVGELRSNLALRQEVRVTEQTMRSREGDKENNEESSEMVSDQG